MSTIGTRRIVDIQGTIPPGGVGIFRGHVDHGPPFAPGPTTLQIGDLKLAVSVLPNRGGTDAPDFPAFVVAMGAGGWQKRIDAAQFTASKQVRLSTVLGALATATGEAIDQPAEALLGPSYGWDGCPALAVLADLRQRGAIPSWRVAPNGHTRFDPWPSSGAADAAGVIEDRRIDVGARYVALSERVAAWLPGATVQGVAIARTTLVEQGGALSAIVWTS